LFLKVEGIVLRTIDYGESNKILTIFTRELGKIGAVARGAKKPQNRLAPVSQPFTYGYFLVSIGSGLGTIRQGEIINAFPQLKEDIFRMAYATYIAELLDRGTEERKASSSLFELLYEILKDIGEGLDPQILKNIFEMKMLPVLGFRPQVDGCALCGRKEGPFVFSVKEGGFLCYGCRDKDPYHLAVSEATVRLLRLFYHLDMKRLGHINVRDSTKKELERCIGSIYDEYTGLALKSKRFLEQIEALK
jgi:DNA replication and repair protein RecO